MLDTPPQEEGHLLVALITTTGSRSTTPSISASSVDTTEGSAQEESHLLVAPITTTAPRSTTPSISASSVDTIEASPQEESHLLVAPMTATAPRSTTPSISASSVDTTEAKTWSPLLLLAERAGTRPSNSSKKMMEGAILVACKQPSCEDF